jgi:hypothetical protein
MSFRRQVLPAEVLKGEGLTAALVGIGMNFAARAAKDPNIEDTLFFAAREALEESDLRLFSVLVTWLEVHAQWINAHRLIRLTSNESSSRVCAFWSAVGRWLSKDRRFAKLVDLHHGPRVDLLTKGTSFQVARHGEDPRFEAGPLRVPANAVRSRDADVLPPVVLATRHVTYHHRLLMGASYRADMWAALDSEPTLTAAELARRAYGSFATAWQVKRDFAILHPQRAKVNAAQKEERPAASAKVNAPSGR